MNLTVAVAVALLVLGALAVRAFLDYQHRQLFKPVRAVAPLSPNPGDYGVNYESVRFGTDNGLHGWHLPLDDQASTLLFCHGNRGNLSDRVASCLLYRGMGFNVFALDYRGYGLSAGHPNELGLYEDAFSAWRYLTETRGVAPDNIALV
ncbi:MAG: alpha/beta hydrolase, partial [Pseudomonadota bacterium]